MQTAVARRLLRTAPCLSWHAVHHAAGPGGPDRGEVTEEEHDRVRAAYGSNYDRLVAVKNAYDPSNLFRANQNIRPTK